MFTNTRNVTRLVFTPAASATTIAANFDANHPSGNTSNP
jgi:hypothetical protein